MFGSLYTFKPEYNFRIITQVSTAYFHTVNSSMLSCDFGYPYIGIFGVGVSCRNLYSFVVYLYVNGSGSITSVEEI